MDSKFKIFNFIDASSNKSNFNSEELHYAPIDSIIHNFLETPTIMDCENIIYFIIPSQQFHPLGLFKDKHLKELSFPTLFYGQLQ
jgi:hypothetical protein